MADSTAQPTSGAAPASAPPPGFTSIDNDPGGRGSPASTAPIEIPDDLFVEEGAEEGEEAGKEAPAKEKPETKEEPGEEASEELEWEVDGQRVTSDEILEYMANKSKQTDMTGEFSTLMEDYERAQAENSELSRYRGLHDFFQKNPDLRREVEAKIGKEFDQLSKSEFSDNPEIAALQRENKEMREFVKEAQIAQADREIDAIFSTLAKEPRYEGIIDDDFKKDVLTPIYDTFKGDPRFGTKTLAASIKAAVHVIQKATEKAEKKGKESTLRAVRKQGVVRLVPPGTSRDLKKPAKDYKKMSADQLAEAFAEEVGP